MDNPTSTSGLNYSTEPGQPIKLHENRIFSVLFNGYSHYIEYNRCPNGALVIPRFSNGDFLLVQQPRCPEYGLSIEFPRGGIEPGETPDIAGYRELAEETGYLVSSDKMTALGQFGPCTAALNVKMYVYLVDLPDSIVPGKYDTEEISQILRMPEHVFRQLVVNGEIRCGQTLAAYSLYLVNCR